jgi:hypothetical protein
MLRNCIALPALIGESAPERTSSPDHALRRDDVATLAIRVQHQGDVRGAVRIVLDALDDALDAVLVATEIDQAILLLATRRPCGAW